MFHRAPKKYLFLIQAGLLFQATLVLLIVKSRLQRCMPRLANSSIIWAHKFLFYGIFLGFLILIFPKSPLASLILSRQVDALSLMEGRGVLTSGAELSTAVLYFKNIAVRSVSVYAFVFLSIAYFCQRLTAREWAIMFAMATMMVTYDLSKAPFMFLVFSIVVTRLSVGPLGSLSPIVYLVTSVIFLVFVYGVVFEVNGITLLNVLAERIFIAQYTGMVAVVDLFPEKFEYLNFFEVTGLLGSILGYETKSHTLMVMSDVNSANVEAGISGYMATYAGAEGYAIGGSLGFFLSVLIASFWLLWMDGLVKGFEYHGVRALYLACATLVPRFMIDSVSGMIINYGVLFIGVFFVVISLTFHRGRIF